MPDENNELDNQMMRLIKRKVESFNPYRRAKLVDEKANIAYLCGHQNIKVEKGAIVPIAALDKYWIPVRANKILPAVRNDIAVSTKSAPTFDIVPAGTDEDDKSTAKACEKIMPYLQRINDPHLHRKAVVLWYDISGSGWRKIYWNPYFRIIGRNPLPDEEGHNPSLEVMAPIFQGEVIVEHVPNNELIYDWRVKDIRRLKWIIHHKAITLGEVRSKFGDDVADKIPKEAYRKKHEENSSFEIELYGEFSGMSNELVQSKTPDESKLPPDDKYVDYYELWHIADRTMPQGAYAVGLGDLKNLIPAINQPYPIEQYPHGELPFVGASPLPISGVSISSVPPISQARPLQREYNEIRSKILDHIDAMGNAVMFAPKGANLDYKKIDNIHGNIIEYEGPMNKPTREPGVPLEGGIFAHLNIVRNDLDEIFAFHEPSKGIMPEGGPRSAIGLQTLQEADFTQLSPVVRGLDESDERVAFQMLSLALANYEDRMVQVIGEDNKWTLAQVNAAELNGKINVIVRTGSSLPLNKTLEQEKTVFAWQNGLLGPPMDPSVRAKVLKAMDLGAFNQVLEDNAKQANFAKREFLVAEQLAGQMPQVGEDELEEAMNRFVFVPDINSFDDHYVHQQEHSNAILEKYYKFMASGLPQFMALAQAMVLHNDKHAMAIQQMQMAQVQQEMMIKGTTPEQIILKKSEKKENKEK